LMESAEFAALRNQCVRFLYDQKHGATVPAKAPAPLPITVSAEVATA